MNCNRFRFLIQQRFEFELPSQDERLLAAHLDSCESCLRFEHQIDQVIQAAQELPFPEEAVPINLESVARMIMQQLPQPKSSPMEIFARIFGGGKDKAPKKEAPAQTATGSHFPHVKRQQSASEQSQTASRAKKLSISESEEQQATSMRLNRMSKRTIQHGESGDQTQSGIQSLGAKFGKAVPAQGQLRKEQPLTLADTIRKKVSEDMHSKEKQSADDAGEASQPPAAQWIAGDSGANAPDKAGWGAPPDLSVAGQGAPVSGDVSSGGGNLGAPAGGSWDQPPESWEQSVAPAAPTARDQGWGQPASAPAGGSWDQPAESWVQPAATAVPADQGWGMSVVPVAPTVPADQGWATPAAPAGGSWSESGTSWHQSGTTSETPARSWDEPATP